MYPTLFTTPGVKAFAEAVDAERQRQLAKFGEQHHPDGSGGPEMRRRADEARTQCQYLAANGGPDWRAILLEEVYEALAETDADKLRTELIQVAAVVAAWTSDIDSRALAAECPAALLPLGSAPVEPCVMRGRHDEHQTAEGRRWSDDLNEQPEATR